ncbi:MAG: hypothetical protein J5725_01615 [Bacteroidales bacterium]|nr:hypothetical protein [Bacteroidales bacterium]
MFYTRISTILTMVLGVLLLNSCQKEFTITVQSNNEAWGNVIGGGEYKKGTIVQLLATPATGYQFGKWDDGNTDNPRSITVEKNTTYIAFFVAEGGGGGEEPVYAAAFSVSASQKVLFSPGNLQWSATNGGSTPTTHVVADGTAEGTWRFAPNQWDTIGANNSNVSSTYTGWIDLFGWGTSGYDNKYPYLINTNDAAYGNGENDITGTNYDWGVYNAIYNSKTQTTDAPGTWRTLTKDEWEYLLNTRTTSSGIRYAKAKVHGMNGLVIVQDNWNNSVYALDSTNIYNTTYASNIINSTDWAKMEAEGCIFLPAAGIRGATSVNYVGSTGEYRSTTHESRNHAYNLTFNSPYLGVDAGYGYGRYIGCSVRLVKDVQ